MATKKKAAKKTAPEFPTVNDVYEKVWRKGMNLRPTDDETPREFRERVEKAVAKRWELVKSNGDGVTRTPISVSLLRKFRSGGGAKRRPNMKSCPQFYADLRKFFPDVDPVAWYQATPAGRDRPAER